MLGRELLILFMFHTNSGQILRLLFSLSRFICSCFSIPEFKLGDQVRFFSSTVPFSSFLLQS